MKPLVVKLGGSTAGQEEMQGWIDVLATAAFPLVIVPGGGPFADHVRFSQKRLGYSDAAAHDMAILAMDQYGHVIAERHSRLCVVRSIQDMRQTWRARRVPVWLPSTMSLAAPDIPRSWEVTSDSLAAWLCRKIDADTLLLVKQIDLRGEPESVKTLVETGIVDPMLPRFLGDDTTLFVAGPQSLREELKQLPLKEIPGCRIAQAALEGAVR
ncbi:MAG: dihydroneopterin aldolase [Phyllobacterium sp.]